MKIIDILNSGKISLSFEVFPPRDDMEKEAVFSAARKIAELNPSFMSITFRTVPGTGESTVELAGELQQEFNIPQLAHLTCATSTKESVFSTLEKLKTHGIQNVLALRGDLPEGITYPTDYKYAVQLIKDIKTSGDFCIGAACYPEGHPEAATKTDDIIHRAFGVVENPTWEDFLEFLEERCFPRTRDNLKLILQDLELDFYDPFYIIEKTQGRMGEDMQWLKVTYRNPAAI